MLIIDKRIYDVAGIGIGPFNLGMAAILEDLPQLSSIFFDQSPEFNWHAGMLLPNARLQVPFYADLTTVVNPCSKFTFLNYLKQRQKLFRFAIQENNFPFRNEYNDYCKWVVEQLDNLHFHHKIVDLHYDFKEDVYTIMVHNLSSDQLLFYYAKQIVIGVGTQPNFPPCIKDMKHKTIIHSADYLFKKDFILKQSQITVVGSGQSAAEIFYDLLNYTDHLENLSWFTRSARFFPMEYSKLSLEMTSLDYIDHFYSLSGSKKKQVINSQDQLYKGINYALINDIYDALYLKAIEGDTSFIQLHANAELKEATVNGNDINLKFYHKEIQQHLNHTANALILATGYKMSFPSFLNSIREQIELYEDGQYNVTRNYAIDVTGKRIFVQNADLHSHGFTAPDLGMGPYRNATILNTILGYEHFILERKVAFQTFGL